MDGSELVRCVGPAGTASGASSSTAPTKSGLEMVNGEVRPISGDDGGDMEASETFEGSLSELTSA